MCMCVCVKCVECAGRDTNQPQRRATGTNSTHWEHFYELHGLGLRLGLGSCMMRLHEGVVSPIAADPFYLLAAFVQLLVQQLSHTEDECEVSILQNA